MPRAKGASKKGQTKAAAAVAADANNAQDLAEVGEKLTSEVSGLTNGFANEEDLKEPEVTVTKRSSGRGGKKEEKMVTEATVEKEAPKKKPAAKGRGKKKVDENEVIENKIESQIENNEQQEDAVEETSKEVVETKPKGKGGKKAATAKKSTAKAKEAAKETTPPIEAVAEEPLQEEEPPQEKVIEKKTKASAKTKAKDVVKETPQIEIVTEEPLEEAKVTEKKTKASGGRKKKQDTKEQNEIKENDKLSEPALEPAKRSPRNSKKIVENLDENDKLPEPVLEKVKKSPRNSKKTVENLEEIVKEETAEEESVKEEIAKAEPPKKKGRAAKKEAVVVKAEESGEIEKSVEVQAEIVEKKPTKRGRAAAAKTSAKIDESEVNAAVEEELPKKRSRKAPSVEKEIAAFEEKPKKGRAKKADKIEKPQETAKEEEDIETNGQVKLENIKETEEEPPTSKKKAEKKAPAPARGGRKRAAPSANAQQKSADDADHDKVDNGEANNVLEDDDDDEAEGSKPKKSKKKTDSAAAPLNATTTKYSKADFDLAPLPEGQTADEPRFNLKISSWNVAGLRAWLKKDGLKYLEFEEPDIFCMQETKCETEKLPEEVKRIAGYHPYWLCMPGGYAGVAIYSKIMPINVEYGIGHKEFDDVGRIITAEYEKFFLVNVYVPNSGRKLVNLEPRMKWEKLFQAFIEELNARKPVVICGDMNVSHQEHDLANPKSNTRNAGFTKEERDKMTELLSLGYVDTFRHLYPERKGAYTFWTYMGNARSRNVGWRLDYFIVSERFVKRVVDNCIRSQCMGSDHCPITLFLKL